MGSYCLRNDVTFSIDTISLVKILKLPVASGSAELAIAWLSAAERLLAYSMHVCSAKRAAGNIQRPPINHTI